MTFTDDHLRKLKEFIGLRVRQGRGTEWSLTMLHCRRLLTRLEVAEEFCAAAVEFDDILRHKAEYKAWRKAAGK